MCGRYTLYAHEDDLATLFEVETYPLTARYNIAPTQSVPVIRQRRDGQRVMEEMRWGLVPHWVKDPKAFKANLFNARSESAAEKPSFRDAMKTNRCIVPASGFYEWKVEGAGKQPYYIQRTDGQPMAFAGLYSVWTKGSEPLVSCTILTTESEGPMRELHHRVPVILEPGEWDRWMDPSEVEPRAVEDLLDPPEDDVLTWYRVDRLVGNARVDAPELIERV